MLAGKTLIETQELTSFFNLAINFLSAISLSTYIVYNKITSISAVRKEQQQAMHNKSNYPVGIEVTSITS